jgi:hypothetical protein
VVTVSANGTEDRGFECKVFGGFIHCCAVIICNLNFIIILCVNAKIYFRSAQHSGVENYVTGALLFLPSRLTANQTLQKSSSSTADLTTLMGYDPSTWNYGRPQRLAALRPIYTVRHISEMSYGTINRINPIFVVQQIHVV